MQFSVAFGFLSGFNRRVKVFSKIGKAFKTSSVVLRYKKFIKARGTIDMEVLVPVIGAKNMLSLIQIIGVSHSIRLVEDFTPLEIYSMPPC